jgi:hypothetical protein
MKENLYLMNSHTGSVDTLEQWQQDARDSVGTEMEWSFDEAGLIPVVWSNEKMDWIEDK